MRTRIVGLFWALALMFDVSIQAEPLTIGDSAPPFAVGKWIKGDKVDQLKPDQTYVVEFWATWCGPCRTSIPHLTELQKKYKDRGVSVLGISVWESDPDEVAPFVQEMGKKMNYGVAIDDVPKGEKADAGKMAQAWMKASESNGIPTAFIVREGKIAWIGHPMELDEPLSKVVEGKWDLAEAATKRREAKAFEKKLEGVILKLRPLLQTQKFKEAVSILDEAFAQDPKVEEELNSLKFRLLLESRLDKEASEYGEKLFNTLYHDKVNGLQFIARTIVDPGLDLPAKKRDLNLAQKAAERANELAKGENAGVLSTLAKVYFDQGKPARAVEAQEKAIKQLKQENPEFKEQLETYKKAAAESAKK